MTYVVVVVNIIIYINTTVTINIINIIIYIVTVVVRTLRRMHDSTY